MLHKILAVIGILACAGLIYILNTTTPSTTGAFGVLVVFFLSYIVLVALLAFGIFWTYKLIKKVFYGEVDAVYNPEEFSFKQSYYYGSVLALGPVLLVSLKSVGKAGLIEVLLVVFLMTLGCLYVSRQTS
jgi:hypothetical protein